MVASRADTLVYCCTKSATTFAKGLGVDADGTLSC